MSDQKNKLIELGKTLAQLEEEVRKVRSEMFAIFRRPDVKNGELALNLNNIDKRVMDKAKRGYLGDFSNAVLVNIIEQLDN